MTGFISYPESKSKEEPKKRRPRWHKYCGRYHSPDDSCDLVIVYRESKAGNTVERFANRVNKHQPAIHIEPRYFPKIKQRVKGRYELRHYLKKVHGEQSS